MASVFLRAEWRKLAMANYACDPAVLRPYLPAHTELDLWKDTCYVSLVGFMFRDTRIKGFRVPFHINFEEVNLRFYVRYNNGGQWRRGVVFIKEIVPRPALTWIANTLYKENYETMPMRHQWHAFPQHQSVSYSWRQRQHWHDFRVKAALQAQDIVAGCEAEFITEHYWGYTRLSAAKTSEYEVAHPRWQVYEVSEYNIDVDFGSLYGADFRWLNAREPLSVFLAEGSPVEIFAGRQL